MFVHTPIGPRNRIEALEWNFLVRALVTPELLGSLVQSLERGVDRGQLAAQSSFLGGIELAIEHVGALIGWMQRHLREITGRVLFGLGETLADPIECGDDTGSFVEQSMLEMGTLVFGKRHLVLQEMFARAANHGG